MTRGRNRFGLVVDSSTSKRLGGIRQSGTDAELLVRRAGYALGFRFRVDNRDLPGRPDLANRRRRWVIFVNGCFWHRHRGCRRTTTPKRNRDFWIEKFRANVARDHRVTRQLIDVGFTVLTIWECVADDQRALERTLRQFAQALAKRVE